MDVENLDTAQKKGPEKYKYPGTEYWKTVQNIVCISDSYTSESDWDR